MSDSTNRLKDAAALDVAGDAAMSVPPSQRPTMSRLTTTSGPDRHHGHRSRAEQRISPARAAAQV